jgi:hypothetical protein
MKTLAWRLFFAVLFSMPLCATPLAVRDLGIPVKGVSWTRLHPGKTADGRASLLISMGQNHGGLFVLDVDLATGRCRQFAAADGVRSTFPTAAYRSLRTGILYLGSAWDGHLHRFDANHPERGIEDLGRVDEAGTFGLGITETPDGAIWIGSYPGARLTKFDPATGQFTRHGRKDATDEYLYPLGGDDGSLAAIVKGRASAPAAHRSRHWRPPRSRPHRHGSVRQNPIPETLQRHRPPALSRLACRRFRIDGLLLTPVDELPAPLPGVHATYKHNYQAPAEMPGGWTAHFLDDSVNGVGTPRNLLLTHRDPLVPSRRLHLDWVGGGSNLHVMELGPDGHLYGSSYMPNRLFRASLDGATVEDLGEHTFAGGEAYSLATLDGKIYLASYPEARLSVFDPGATGALRAPRRPTIRRTSAGLMP